MTTRTVAIVLAGQGVTPDAMKQVHRGHMVPAQTGITTHIPDVGQMAGEEGPMQAVVTNDFIYGLTKAKANMVEREGEVVDGVYWPASPEAVVSNVWSRMFDVLNDKDRRMLTYDCTYKVTIFPGNGTSHKVSVNAYEVVVDDYDLKVHYISHVGPNED